jgi:hypothetical protein
MLKLPDKAVANDRHSHFNSNPDKFILAEPKKSLHKPFLPKHTFYGANHQV